ncbi:hypothetical protein [Romboutsia ilealis]|uniref:hypothetical protein n=1 Tax=Romboutsia ilealis TaxID=1115758 RepID=UPI0025746E9E|nr:hypothetical protein [Romboutsia ilealis]
MKILVNGYTVTEHMKLKRSSKLSKNEFFEIEKYIDNLKKNKHKYLQVVFLIALIIPSSTLKVFADSFISSTGLEYYSYIKEMGFIICLFGAAVEAIKCVATGTIDQVSKIAIKYAAFGLLIVFLPKFVSLIFSMGGN